MDEQLKTILASDEKLLWSGKPESFETIDKTNKPIFAKKLIIALAVAVVLTVGYFILAAKNETDIKWALLVFVWIVCALPPINVFKDAKDLRNKASYVLTDRRYITLIGTVKEVEIDKCGKVYFVTDADGHTSLVTGMDGEKNLKTNLREAAVVGASMDTESNKCDRYVMYAVDDVKGLREALKKTPAVF